MTSSEEREICSQLGWLAVRVLNNGALKIEDPSLYFALKDAASLLRNPELARERANREQSK